jgi:hypothetical protein
VHKVVREAITLRTVVGGLALGCVLVWVLMLVVPAAAAGLAACAAGVIAQIYWLKYNLDSESDQSIGFWMIIGAAAAVCCGVLKDFSGAI